MKLNDFLRVEALIVHRHHLVSLRDEGRIEITISGIYQNRSFVDAIEPAIKLELRHRIREIDEQLADFGVIIDCENAC